MQQWTNMLLPAAVAGVMDASASSNGSSQPASDKQSLERCLDSPRQDASAAIQRLSEGIPAGSGATSLRFADKLLTEVGGRLCVLPVARVQPSDHSSGTCVHAWIPGIKHSQK